MDNKYGRRAEDVKLCDNSVICPTSIREMHDLRTSVDKAEKDYEKLTNEIKTNRKFDIAILAVGILGLIINLVMRSM